MDAIKGARLDEGGRMEALVKWVWTDETLDETKPYHMAGMHAFIERLRNEKKIWLLSSLVYDLHKAGFKDFAHGLEDDGGDSDWLLDSAQAALKVICMFAVLCARPLHAMHARPPLCMRAQPFACHACAQPPTSTIPLRAQDAAGGGAGPSSGGAGPSTKKKKKVRVCLCFAVHACPCHAMRALCIMLLHARASHPPVGCARRTQLARAAPVRAPRRCVFCGANACNLHAHRDRATAQGSAPVRAPTCPPPAPCMCHAVR